MTSALPERLEIEVLADGRPLPGALVDVKLAATAKNSHTMVFGPANEHGRIVATRAEVEAKAASNCLLFVMDYADLRSHFAGSIEVSPATPRRIGEMQQAYDSFSSVVEYPNNWSSALKTMEHWFSTHQVRSLVARVQVAPPGIEVSAVEATL